MKHTLSAPPRPPEPFDARAAKRIARGRREIDARLDLHGLRQQDAYVALRRFLARCQAEDLRHVLIITGKGSGDKREEREFWTAEERGVLRRLVPHWLCEPGDAPACGKLHGIGHEARGRWSAVRDHT